MCQSVSNFLSYVSAKHYLNLITDGRVITEINMVNVLLRHSVFLEEIWHKIMRSCAA